MQHSFRFRQGLAIIMGTVFLIISAVGGSILLGRLYIKVLSKGNGQEGYAKTEQVSSSFDSSKKISKAIKLEVVPIYFLQAGVFNDAQSARKKVAELKEMGHLAYFSNLAPYKVYLGVYLKKEAALEAKKITDVQNISTYISSVVMNNNEIVLPDLKQITSPEQKLKQFNEWLQLNLALFEIQQLEKVQSAQFKDKLAKTEDLYQNSVKLLAGHKELQEWSKPVEEYYKLAHALPDNWTVDNFQLAQVKLMEVISEYIIWTQKNIDK